MNEYTLKELNVPAPGGDLHGELYLPGSGTGVYPMVIVCHGLYHSYTVTRETAAALAKKGFAAYCFDFHGCSFSNASGGDITESSILTEKEETEACIHYFKQQAYVEKKRLFLLGQSMGTVVSSLAAKNNPNDIARMVLMYPAFHIFDILNRTFPEIENIPEIVKDFMGFPGMDLGRRFFVDALNCNFFDEIKAFTHPVLILHGTEDEQAPLFCGEKARDTFADSKLIVEEGKAHGYQLDESNIAWVVDFLNGA